MQSSQYTPWAEIGPIECWRIAPERYRSRRIHDSDEWSVDLIRAVQVKGRTAEAINSRLELRFPIVFPAEMVRNGNPDWMPDHFATILPGLGDYLGCDVHLEVYYGARGGNVICSNLLRSCLAQEDPLRVLGPVPDVYQKCLERVKIRPAGLSRTIAQVLTDAVDREKLTTYIDAFAPEVRFDPSIYFNPLFDLSAHIVTVR